MIHTPALAVMVGYVLFQVGGMQWRAERRWSGGYNVALGLLWVGIGVWCAL